MPSDFPTSGADLGDTQQTSRRRIEDADLFGIQLPREPLVSRDGEWLLFLLETPDAGVDATVRRLRVINLSDRREEAFDQIGNVLHARWTADGAMIVVLPDGDGARVGRLDRGGQFQPLAALPCPPSHVEVAPDGSALALTMSVPFRQSVSPLPPCLGDLPADRRGRLIERTVWRMDGIGELSGADQVFRLDLTSGVLDQLTDDLSWVGYFVSGISWSYDSREILLAMNLASEWERCPFDSSIYALNVATRARREVTGGEGANVSPRGARWTNQVAFRHAEDTGAFHLVPTLWTVSLDGSQRRLAADVGQDIGRAEWDWAGTGLYFSFVHEGVQKLRHVEETGSIREVACGLATDGAFEVEPYLGGGGEFCACPQGVIAVIATSSDPGRLVLIDFDGTMLDLSRPNAALLDQILLGRTEELSVELPTGERLQSWLVYPPDYDPARSYPLILEIHGGPDLAFGGHFAFRAQRYAAEGYLVLMPNYRGSSGTDQSIYDDGYCFPGREYDELLTAMDAAILRAPIDLQRLYVSGLSAGGVLSAWIIGKSHRFAAAAVRGPVINWTSHALSHDLYSMYASRWLAATPWEDPMEYWRRSPLSLVGEMRTPTLIVHGEADVRTPATEGLQLYHALRLRGVPAALLLLPGAAHVSIAPSHWLEEQNFILDWFGRHALAAA